jgi:hypothetical protein
VADEAPRERDYARRHLRFGWWSLAVFATLGLVLESFHGFKVRAYLDVPNETRRLMWTLAHAHGTLLSVVHVIFGLSVRVAPEVSARDRPLISRCLIGASVLLPGGFFLGGVAFYGGDPGIGIVLVPVGAIAMIIAAIVLARLSATSVERHGSGQPGGSRGRREPAGNDRRGGKR